jgi:hypothetical protein
VIEFEQIGLEFGNRFGGYEDRGSVEAKVGGGVGLSFDDVSRENCGGIVSLVAIDPHAALGM